MAVAKPALGSNMVVVSVSGSSLVYEADPSLHSNLSSSALLQLADANLSGIAMYLMSNKIANVSLDVINFALLSSNEAQHIVISNVMKLWVAVFGELPPNLSRIALVDTYTAVTTINLAVIAVCEHIASSNMLA